MPTKFGTSWSARLQDADLKVVSAAKFREALEELRGTSTHSSAAPPTAAHAGEGVITSESAAAPQRHPLSQENPFDPPPVSPYPLNFGGGRFTPKISGVECPKPLVLQCFREGRPQNLRGEMPPPKFKGYGLTGPNGALMSKTLKKNKLDNRQITHLICVRLKQLLYDFLGGVLGLLLVVFLIIYPSFFAHPFFLFFALSAPPFPTQFSSLFLGPQIYSFS